MLTPHELDAYAAALATLGRFHRQAPDEQTLSAFEELLSQWPVAPSGDAQRGLELLAESFAAGESAHQIKADLNGLYGVSAKARIAPYESVHRDRDGLVFDRQTLLVRDFYRRLGLEVPRLNREPDDHVGIELDFLAQCLLRALDAQDAGEETLTEEYVSLARGFLTDHVNQWAPQMLTEAARLANTRFNQGVCLLSIGTLESLDERL